MATWRMAFRCGNRGPSLWSECFQLGVAAITYEPLARVDLSAHPEGEPKALWAKLAPTQKASLRRVAYEMKSGDVIYVKEGPKIISRGEVTGPYRFDSQFRIVDHEHGLPWAHHVPVKWQADFPEIRVLLGAEQVTVMPLGDADIEKVQLSTNAVQSRHVYLARLCWNTHGWVSPSGDAAKTESRNTYATTMGFGHEEWLFNFNWLMDGWKYSFLQPVNRSIRQVRGEVIDVRLFSRDSPGSWSYVGEIKACEVLTHEQAQLAREEFRARGWLGEMEGHVRSLGGDIRGLQQDDPCNLFNIRFRRQNAELYDPPVPADSSDAIRRITRYLLVPLDRQADVTREWATRVASVRDRPTGKVHRKAVSAGVMELVHNRMQGDLAERLRAKYGDDAVLVEEGFVDIKLRDGKRLVFLEIKSDCRPLRALREALGQLLEYEFYARTHGEMATELLVVAPGELSRREREYVEHLRERWSLPIRYVCIGDEPTDLLI